MKIILTKDNLFIGSRTYQVNDILDLEIDGKRKKKLVEAGLADWLEEPVRNATQPKVSEKATVDRKVK